jgi:hypothetical protein
MLKKLFDRHSNAAWIENDSILREKGDKLRPAMSLGNYIDLYPSP